LRVCCTSSQCSKVLWDNEGFLSNIVEGWIWNVAVGFKGIKRLLFAHQQSEREIHSKQPRTLDRVEPVNRNSKLSIIPLLLLYSQGLLTSQGLIYFNLDHAFPEPERYPPIPVLHVSHNLHFCLTSLTCLTSAAAPRSPASTYPPS
jgi:hypothetical protein